MSVISNNILAGASGQSGGAADLGYQIERSLRFNNSDGSYLSFTPQTNTNSAKWTVSMWVKIAGYNSSNRLFGIRQDTNNYFEAYLDANSQKLNWYFWGSGIQYQLTTSQVFRDHSAWYHLLFWYDSGDSIANDRAHIYVNGVQVTAYDTKTNPTQNFTSLWNSAREHRIGASVDTNGNFFDGQIAEVHSLDGILPGTATDDSVGSVTGIPGAKYLTDFGEFNTTTGVWVPKEYTGSYGTNGFYLKFDDASSKDALGTDSTSNGNDWTVNNIDTSTTDYATTFTGTQRSGFEWTKVFDRDLNQGSIPDANSTWTWTPSTTIPFTTLAVYAYKDSTPGGLEINNTSVITQIPNHNGIGPNQRTVITGISSPLTSIKNISTGTLANVVVAGIEIDGTVLLAADPEDVDSLFDSPTNGDPTLDTGLGGELSGNYATFNGLITSSTVANARQSFADGNLKLTSNTSGNYGTGVSTIAVSSGKWYCEFTYSRPGSSDPFSKFGLTSTSRDFFLAGNNELSGQSEDHVVGFTASATNYQSAGSNLYTYANGGISDGDVIMLAYDATAGKLWFGQNGTWLTNASGTGDPSTGTNPDVSGLSGEKYLGAAAYSNGTSNEIVANFGQRAFAYTAPSGFKALCTANLPTPDIADGSTAMDVVKWTGTGSSQTVPLGFDADLIWTKTRSNAVDHKLVDSVRGLSKYSETNQARVDATDANGVTGTSSSGFTVGTSTDFNTLNRTYVGWTWNGGTAFSNSANTNGATIASSGVVNQDAGFSIVSWTGNRSNATVRHGLNADLKFLVVKNRDQASNWMVWHEAISGSEYLSLNTANAKATATTVWNSTIPTSSVFSLGADTESNGNTDEMIAYCWAPVEGYSAFGSYQGTNNTSGPFVYLGFRPKFVLIKNASLTSAYTSWFMQDSTRNPYNPASYTTTLWANRSDLEGKRGNGDPASSFFDIDFLSNGFKIPNTGGGNHELSQSGYTYIYAAFAEHPFRHSRAR